MMKTKEQILLEIEALKQSVNQLQPNTNEILRAEENNNVRYIRFPKEIDSLFMMIYFHKTDYEEYLFLDNYILACLKKRLSKVLKEIANLEHLKEKTTEGLLKFNSTGKQNKNEKLPNIDGLIFDLYFCDRRIKELTPIVEKLEKDIKSHKTYAKEESILSEEDIPKYEAWLRYKNSEIEFNNVLENQEIDITNLENSISKTEIEMQELIDKYNS
ncbi:MAG: hypothetical protein K6C98_02710 [Treponema sp.]|nr:hypothetical protein [Treponema sp.]